MEIIVDKSVLGKRVAIIEQSPVSNDPIVREGVITGILINKEGETEVRFGKSKWVKSEWVFELHEITKKLAEFNARFNKNEKESNK